MTFGDELREAFEQMMLYREAVGYATATYRSSVPPFIDYCVRNYTDDRVITQQMLDRWLAHYSYTANSRAVFVSLIREYTRYLHFLGRDDFIPDDDYSTKRIAFSPYLFTDEELYRLFFAFDGCTGATCGKRYFPEMILPVYSRLLFCCGMRPRNRRHFFVRMWTCQQGTFISGSQNDTKTGTLSFLMICLNYAADMIH